MKKKSITLMVVFCIFIICSFTYQPIVANESVDTAFDVKDISHNNRFEKININSIIRLLLKGSNSGNDCGCDDESKGLWPFPFICGVLYIISEISLRFGISIAGPPFLHMIASIIASIFHCRWVYPNL